MRLLRRALLGRAPVALIAVLVGITRAPVLISRVVLPVVAAVPPPVAALVLAIPLVKSVIAPAIVEALQLRTVTWTTDVPASSQVESGSTSAYGAKTVYDRTRVTSHSVQVGLGPADHYRVLSRDRAGTERIGMDRLTSGAVASALSGILPIIHLVARATVGGIGGGDGVARSTVAPVSAVAHGTVGVHLSGSGRLLVRRVGAFGRGRVRRRVE